MLRHRLRSTERDTLAGLGLYYITYMPEIRANTGLLTTLAERWHPETSSFHLATGEATVTLEDVWHILHIPIHGEMIEYDPVTGRDALCRLFEWR